MDEPMELDADRERVLQAAAYEALWLREKASFKYFSDLRRSGATSDLKDLVSDGELYHSEKELSGYLSGEFGELVNIKLISDADYPNNLLDAVNPINLFYSIGDWQLCSCAKKVSIIGSRSVSFDGLQRAHRLTKILVENGFVVISGLARGVDSIAHEAAMHYGGRTIGVIGTPILDYYPKENWKLQNKVARNHLLISQVPALRYKSQDFKLNRHFFPERNATMSAIADATVIIEASDKSGTLTQAKHAIAQGRKLFILNSCFEKDGALWPWDLLKKGAVRVKSPSDILSYFS
ncbi:DNA-processing protein DprA [Salinicola aestuarinus]|uniref:DNA-processing protein DprA n=1 Tax=Salinicola aestuarinus TaxID=1949082 RepID=UPI000DA18549|nr:DNA-processing protein DprA [Salinicola aestuarinus]